METEIAFPAAMRSEAYNSHQVVTHCTSRRTVSLPQRGHFGMAARAELLSRSIGPFNTGHRRSYKMLKQP